MARIELDRANLVFHPFISGRSSLKEVLLRPFMGRDRATSLTVHALKDVSFQLKDGERLGVIGHNGAGKSTLLKLLAGVYSPTAGRRLVKGRISSLFDLTLGFEAESTGWENIYFRGYLHGETRRTVRRRVNDIAAFCELGQFLDMPVRFYSSGMLVKLAFAVATAIDPEVLLIDEVLSAGDLAFQAKARQRMDEMMAKAHLMVVVSHDLASIERLCNRAIWMSQGAIRLEGSTDKVIEAYKSAVMSSPAAA